MKHLPLIVALCALVPSPGFAQQAVPTSPAIWRQVTGVVFTDPANLAGPVFTRPHMPAYRTTRDGRIAKVVEGGGPTSGLGFTLLMPEKMTTPFLLNAGGTTSSSFTMSKQTLTGSEYAHLNVANAYAAAPFNAQDYTDGVKGVSHSCLWDPGNNPQVVAGEDVYNIWLMVTSNSGTSPNNRTQFFSTPLKITVTNPKTTSAYIRLIEKTGPTLASPAFTFQGSAFEPVVCGDGRLLIVRVGSPSMPWTNPNTGAAGATSGHGFDIVYSYYPTGNVADASQWTNIIPITFAPSDTRINTKFGFAMAPFRDAEGTLIPPGEDIGASYPWIDRDAKNLFFESVFDKLHYLAGGTYNNARYPQQPNTNEPADYVQGEDGGKHQGISMVGLWTHGKVVMIDNLNNATDYAVGQGDSSAAGGTSTGPQHRLVSLFQPNSGPLGNENGLLMLGYGRSTKKMPPGENDNANIIDSIENSLNYRKEAFPLTRRDVVWALSNGQQADELVFDDYVDPDAFIIANMAGLTTFPTSFSGTGQNSFKHHTSWNTSTNTWDPVNNPVRLQNAATPTTDRWIVPKHGLVVGNGRLEPAATGGVHGKGFSMNGSIGLEFNVLAQPAGVDVTQHDWYVGIFVDCRFTNDTTERRLLTFPDNSSIRLYGRSQVLYADPAGAIINRISLPAPIVGTHPLDDLLPEKGWAHLGFQLTKQNTAVDFFLNGIIYGRWEDAYQQLFRMTPGKVTVGKLASSSVAGFSGWVDDFKVLAHAVDFETACNHANGSLIGLNSSYTAEWKTKFADRFPAWAQTAITDALRNNGEATYPRYANFYNYKVDNGAHRDNVPANAFPLRQSMHFPEGPLFHNRPRPDSVTNAFCITCHHDNAKPGLDLAALDFDNSWTAANDPRRQPMQPPAKIFGVIPASLINHTAQPAAQPTALTNLGAGGKLIDEWQLNAFNNSATVQSFTIVDATTRKDLMTLTAGATVDPARLGTTNITIRTNLSTAQGNVVMQLDSAATNTKTKPPYTAFGTDANPWVGQVLTPGAHTIRATPQFGSLTSVNFTVAGGATRVVAGYRTDWKSFSPPPGWSYLWNALGPITSAANYRTLNWRVAGNYTANGFATHPDNTVTTGPYISLSGTGGHPGRGANQGATHDRFAIAAYTVKLAGYYGVANGTVTMATAASNGGQVVIYTETSNGATFTQRLNSTFPSVTPFLFSTNVGQLQPGDTIYVGIGPNLSDGSDSFSHDFNIVFKETGNPL